MEKRAVSFGRMLLLTRRIGYTRDMNGDRDTLQHPEERQPENGGNPAAISQDHTASHPPYSPPPPSAPSEFLNAQWIPLAPVTSGIPHPPLAPPPPSAPSEFLSAQWRGKELADSDRTEAEVDVFAEALPETVQSAADLDGLADEHLPSDSPPQSPGEADTHPPVRIRGVPLAHDEAIAQVFLPNEGLATAVPATGQALILTNRRVIAFRGVEGFRDTHFAMTSEITQCSVRTGQRNWAAILQGLMIMVGGGFLYLVVGYWLAGRISGPNIPVLNIDVAPFIALLIILAGLLVLLQNYFTRPAGAVIFHGEGVEIAFPFRSSLDLGQVYEFVDMTYEARRRAVPDAADNPPASHGEGSSGIA